MSVEQSLLALLARLAPEQQSQLLEYGEFLLTRYGAAEPVAIAPPAPAPRPEQESVIAAIRRLSAGYPMLERSKMLHETSALMAQHVMEGRAAAAVIDDLELLFIRYYEQQFGDQVES